MTKTKLLSHCFEHLNIRYSDLFSAGKNTNLIIKGLTLDKQYGKHVIKPEPHDSLERLPVNGTYS